MKEIFNAEDHPGSFVSANIVLGAIIFVISFFGCCGAIRESQCCILIYSILMMAVVVAQIVLAAYVMVYTEDIVKVVGKGFQKLWEDGDQDLNKKVIDVIQKTFECCGKLSVSDYPQTAIPQSCCPENTRQKCNATLSFKVGCGERIDEFIKNSADMISYGSLIAAAFELVGVSFGCCLANHLRRFSRSRYDY